MAHITVQDVGKSEDTLENFKIREYVKCLGFISKVLCTCRFYAKVIDINSSKN
jgi:hypothetical protein